MAEGPLQHLVSHIHRLAGSPAEGGATDEQMLNRFLRGREEAAFAALVARHGPMVLGLCRRLLRDPHHAEDAFQATFLILARKAKALGKPELLGHWLYGVAYRVAVRARQRAEREQARMAPLAPDLTAAGEEGDMGWRDLRPLLDAEINRLSVKHRQPVVLCYLEGKTCAEAARLLHCPQGTIKSRLAAARDLLQQRLTRRGLVLSTGMLAAALSAHRLSANVPSAWMTSTAKAALAAAAGQPLAGAVSASACTLTEGACRSMFIAKLRRTLLLVLVGLIGLGAGAFGLQKLAAPSSNRLEEEVDDGPVRELAKSQPVKGLKLTLEFAPAAAGEDQMPGDGTDRSKTFLRPDETDAETVKLKLTFTNVGAQPIKLNAYGIYWNLVKWAVTGPAKDSIRILPPAHIDRFGPEAADYPVFQPGQSWSPSIEWPFPFKDSPANYYCLKTGPYRIQATYRPSPGKDTWLGEVSSNEILLSVRPNPKTPAVRKMIENARFVGEKALDEACARERARLIAQGKRVVPPHTERWLADRKPLHADPEHDNWVIVWDGRSQGWGFHACLEAEETGKVKVRYLLAQVLPDWALNGGGR
jgi:RNA polymerase sigma factor (sigma-70 family)